MQRKPPGRLPLDLPRPRVGQRGDARYPGRTTEKTEDVDKTASLIRKIFVSAIILVLVLVVRSIDTEFTQKVVGYVKDGVTKDMKVDETLGKLKFVSNFLPDAIDVFGPQQEIPLSFAIPAEGQVVKQFGLDNTGIDILGTKSPNVYAAADGMIIAVGEDDKGAMYIKIDHGNNITTLYEGCSETIVDIGHKVGKGDRIGMMVEVSSGGYTLHFEAQMDGRPVDPLKFMDTEN